MSDEKVARFLREVSEVFDAIHPAQVFHCDETNWLCRRGNLHTIAATGQEAIHHYFPVDSKVCTTVIATINAVGKSCRYDPCVVGKQVHASASLTAS
jgi:hypothetical protein